MKERHFAALLHPSFYNVTSLNKTQNLFLTLPLFDVMNALIYHIFTCDP